MSEWTHSFYKILNTQINIAPWRLITFEIKLWKVLYQFIGWKGLPWWLRYSPLKVDNLWNKVMKSSVPVYWVERASLVAQMVKRLPAVRETRVRSLGWEDPLEKEMATHSSTLAWKIPWTEEPGLQSMGSQRVGHDWATSLHFMPFLSLSEQKSLLNITAYIRHKWVISVLNYNSSKRCFCLKWHFLNLLMYSWFTMLYQFLLYRKSDSVVCICTLFFTFSSISEHWI